MVEYVTNLDLGELASQMAAANKTYDEAVVTQLERVADSAAQQVSSHPAEAPVILRHVALLEMPAGLYPGIRHACTECLILILS
jgi:hypothetical protein